MIIPGIGVGHYQLTAVNMSPSCMIAVIPNNPNRRIPSRITVTIISSSYQVSLFSSRRHVLTSKTSRLTRIDKFISSSYPHVRQHIPMPEPSRLARIQDFISSSHHWAGQCIHMPKALDQQESCCLHKKLPVGFLGALFSSGPKLGTAEKMMCSKAVPDGL